MSESDFYTVNDRYKSQGAAADWPAWELQGYGSAAPAPEPAAPEEPAPACGPATSPPRLDPLGPWFSARLSFADGARIDVLVAVCDDRLTIEDMRADPPLTLDGLATLARWIGGPLDDACRLATGRPRKPRPTPGEGEGEGGTPCPADPSPRAPSDGVGTDGGAGGGSEAGTEPGTEAGMEAEAEGGGRDPHFDPAPAPAPDPDGESGNGNGIGDGTGSGTAPGAVSGIGAGSDSGGGVGPDAPGDGEFGPEAPFGQAALPAPEPLLAALLLSRYPLPSPWSARPPPRSPPPPHRHRPRPLSSRGRGPANGAGAPRTRTGRRSGKAGTRCWP